MYIMDPVDRIVISETPTTTTIPSNITPKEFLCKSIKFSKNHAKLTRAPKAKQKLPVGRVSDDS